MNSFFDLAIVGGGLAGSAAALALQQTGCRIVLIDATDGIALHERFIALNDNSISILKNRNIWPKLATGASPIKQVHVSKQGSLGSTRLYAEDLHLTALGYVTPASHIQAVLYEALQAANVTWLRPAVLQKLTQEEEAVTLTIKMGAELTTLQTKWVIGADGAESMVRSLLNIPAKKVDYQESALVTSVELSRHHGHIAYERFLDQGAIAMLPLAENRVAAILTGPNEQIQQRMEMQDDQFLEFLQKKFGFRLGRLRSVARRMMFPLVRVTASASMRGRVLLIGNALHTVHPVGAQGLNLALAEADEVARYFKLHHTFEGYTPQDQSFNLMFADRLLHFFSKDFFPLSMLRSMLLMGLDVLTPIKKQLIHYAMGRRMRDQT